MWLGEQCEWLEVERYDVLDLKCDVCRVFGTCLPCLRDVSWEEHARNFLCGVLCCARWKADPLHLHLSHDDFHLRSNSRKDSATRTLPISQCRYVPFAPLLGSSLKFEQRGEVLRLSRIGLMRRHALQLQRRLGRDHPVSF